MDGNEKDVKFPESSLQKGQGYEVGETHRGKRDANCFLLGTYAHFSPFQNIPNCVSLYFEKRFVPKVHVSEHLHFFPYKNAKKMLLIYSRPIERTFEPWKTLFRNAIPFVTVL